MVIDKFVQKTFVFYQKSSNFAPRYEEMYLNMFVRGAADDQLCRRIQ